jgi:hypothetical protein
MKIPGMVSHLRWDAVRFRRGQAPRDLKTVGAGMLQLLSGTTYREANYGDAVFSTTHNQRHPARATHAGSDLRHIEEMPHLGDDRQAVTDRENEFGQKVHTPQSRMLASDGGQPYGPPDGSMTYYPAPLWPTGALHPWGRCRPRCVPIPTGESPGSRPAPG